jgi:hypothetical protein
MRHLLLILIAVLSLSCAGQSYDGGSYAPAPSSVNVYGGPVEASRVTVASVESDSEGSVSSSSDDRSSSQPKRRAAAPVDYDQKLVKTGYMRIETDEDDFAKKITELKAATKKLEGYVASESRNSVTIKVPSGRLDELIAITRQLGEVVGQDVHVHDVTATYVDLQIRIDNLKRLRSRLQELIQQGSSVQEVLEVERELARVTRELEQLEGQLRLMDNQVTFATLNVNFENDLSPGPIGWLFYGTYQAVKWLFVWD